MKNKNIIFVIGIFILTGFSLLWFVDNVPVIKYSGNNMQLNKDNIYGVFDNEIGDDLKLGDSSSGGDIVVKESSSVTVPRYTVSSWYACIEQSSSCSNFGNVEVSEASKNSEGVYTPTSCSTCNTTGKKCCYYESKSSTKTFYTEIQGGHLRMTTGDFYTCSILNATIGSDTCSSTYCTKTGVCASNGKITDSGGDASYTNSISYSYNGETTTHSATTTVEHCEPGWSKLGESGYVYLSDIPFGRESIRVGKDYKVTGYTAKVNRGSAAIYKVSRSVVYTRCGGSAPIVSVCVYLPNKDGLGEDFQHADEYAWTDAPDSYESNGWIVDASKTQSQCKGCFGNTPSFARATSVSWTTKGTYKYDNVTSSSACKPMVTPVTCPPKDYIKKVDASADEETDKCEEEKPIFYEDGKDCLGKSQEAFYTIRCANKVANTFDLEEEYDIEEIYDIKQGQSFGYKITSESSKVCYGKFNVDVWKNAYTTIRNRFGLLANESARLDSRTRESEEFWFLRKFQDLFQQIRDYLDWEPQNSEIKPNAEVTLSLNGNRQGLNNPGGAKASNTIVNLNVDEETIIEASYEKKETHDSSIVTTFKEYKDKFEKNKKGEYYLNKNNEQLISLAKDFDIDIKRADSNVNFNIRLNGSNTYDRKILEYISDANDLISKVKNYLWITPTEGKIDLVPPKVSVEALGGEIEADGVSSKISSYNITSSRIFTDKDIEKGNNYELTVVLKNIDKINIELTDKKCKLHVVNTELVYRTIEESNPFINEERKKGYNWLRTGIDGTLYDFSKIIANSSEYSALFELSKNNMSLVKSDNKECDDAYLGGCYYGYCSNACSILRK